MSGVVPDFVNERLHIVIVSEAHFCGHTTESLLCALKRRSRSVADHGFTAVIFGKKDFVAGFESEAFSHLSKHRNLTVCKNAGKIHLQNLKTSWNP